MIGLLIICLIIFALGTGFSRAEYIMWGFNIINFHYPFFRLGLIYEPYTFYDGKGDIYNVKSLKIGFVVATLWIDFYSYMGTNNNTSSTTINLTTYDSTVITTAPLI